MRLFPARALAAMLLLAIAAAAPGQNRGVYPLGLSAIDSGVTPGAGFSYSNATLFYSRDEQVGGSGEVLAAGQQSVWLNMNTLLWVMDGEIAALGGARFSSAATVPIASNSLSSDAQGDISGGAGFGDLYLQPAILSWRLPRADVRAILGMLAPTGRYDPGASDNVGNGYWTAVIASGQSLYLTRDRRTVFSMFQMIEFHGRQSGTGIVPGETLNLDYSLMRFFELSEGRRLQLGIVGYNAWQLGERTGPAITEAQQAERYRVNAVGAGAALALPEWRVNLALKYFQEFSNRWTYQGIAWQFSVGVAL